MNGVRGFSLIELLTVIAVFSVLSTLGMTFFISMSDNWQTTTIRMDLGTVAERALDQIQKDFGQVLPSRVSGVSLRGADGEEFMSLKTLLGVQLARGLAQDASAVVDDSTGRWRPVIESDSVILPIENVNPVTGRLERNSVMYRIDHSVDVPRLTRRIGPLGGDPSDEGIMIVAEGVLSMSIQYFDGAAWRSGWAEGTLPEAARVSLTVIGKNRQYEQIARAASLNIHVK